VILFGRNVFADLIELRSQKVIKDIGWALNLMTGVFMKETEREI
jgi:hypothetical protein